MTMNKKFSILFILILGINSSFAQVNVGLKFRLDISHVSNSGGNNFNSIGHYSVSFSS